MRGTSPQKREDCPRQVGSPLLTERRRCRRRAPHSLQHLPPGRQPRSQSKSGRCCKQWWPVRNAATASASRHTPRSHATSAAAAAPSSVHNNVSKRPGPSCASRKPSPPGSRAAPAYGGSATSADCPNRLRNLRRRGRSHTASTFNRSGGVLSCSGTGGQCRGDAVYADQAKGSPYIIAHTKGSEVSALLTCCPCAADTIVPHMIS